MFVWGSTKKILLQLGDSMISVATLLPPSCKILYHGFGDLVVHGEKHYIQTIIITSIIKNLGRLK